MRALGIFNVCFGLLGLLSSFAVSHLMPQSPLPHEALIAGTIASGWVIFTGTTMIIWGKRVNAFLGRLVKAAFSRLRRPRGASANSGRI